MADMKKMNGLLLGFLAGGVVGGTIALLYAPKSGKSLRNDISSKTNEFIEESRKKANDTWSAAREKAESTLDSANDFLNTSAATIARKAEKVKKALMPEVNSLYEGEKPRNQKDNTYSESSAFAKDAENIM